jgi:hypothetical protein
MVVLILVSKFKTKMEIITLGTNNNKKSSKVLSFENPLKYIPIRTKHHTIF